MNYDISASEFLGIEIINPQSVLNRRNKKAFLLSTTSVCKETVTVFKGTLAVIYTIVKDLAFFPIQLVACIYL